MKNFKVFTILSMIMLGMVIMAISQTKTTIPKSPEEKLAYFLELAEKLRTDLEVPGVGIALVNNNEIIHTGGLGFSDISKKTPVSKNTLFAIGSTTKAFTGVAAAKLAEQGKLDWRKPIINYIPDFKLKEEYVARHMNLEDAFIHMTGLERRDDLWKGKPLTRKEVFDQVKSINLKYGLREMWSYNNHMYVVAGVVLENISGKTWEQLIENEIFSRLEMNNSYTSFQQFNADPQRSTGYQYDAKTIEPHINTDNIGPAGGISSTPKDIANWLKMMVNKGVYNDEVFLQPKEYDYLTTPKRMSLEDACKVRYYSIGWGANQTEGKRYLRHSGGIAGQNAEVLVKPDEGFGIFIMTNQISDYKNLLADYAENIFLYDNYERDTTRESWLINDTYLQRFSNVLMENGIQAAENYHANYPRKILEQQMNAYGYGLMGMDKMGEALAVFQLTIKDYPNSSNAYDSLGECYFNLKKYTLAKENYQKSLTLDASNKNAVTMLEKIAGLKNK